MFCCHCRAGLSLQVIGYQMFTETSTRAHACTHACTHTHMHIRSHLLVLINLTKPDSSIFVRRLLGSLTLSSLVRRLYLCVCVCVRVCVCVFAEFVGSLTPLLSLLTCRWISDQAITQLVVCFLLLFTSKDTIIFFYVYLLHFDDIL